MKSLIPNSIHPAVLLLLSLLVLAGARPAAAAAPAAGKSTNAPALPATIPKAVFDVVSSPVKDPFYPRTTRTPVPVVVTSATTNAIPVALSFTAASFQLKALSGASSARLATINNKVVAVNEDADITTPTGKVRVHVVDIKDFSVVIQAGNQAEPIELRLRQGVQ